jgi:hypothetical protein
VRRRGAPGLGIGIEVAEVGVVVRDDDVGGRRGGPQITVED